MSRLLRNLFGWLTPLIYWFVPSLTGADNKASGRKISSFVFMFLIISTTSKILMRDNPTIIHVYLLGILVCTYLLLVGILTVQNIIDLWKNGKPMDTTTKPEAVKEP